MRGAFCLTVIIIHVTITKQPERSGVMYIALSILVMLGGFLLAIGDILAVRRAQNFAQIIRGSGMGGAGIILMLVGIVALAVSVMTSNPT